MTEAYGVLCHPVLRADYLQALADQEANGTVESFTDTLGREWVSQSALHMEETTNRQGLLQLQASNRKALEDEIAATDEQLKKKDEQFQKKEQELFRSLQELETLASQKRLDDLRFQFEGLQAERAAASHQAAADLALASQQAATVLAAEEINELKALLAAQEVQHANQLAALQQALKTHEAELQVHVVQRESLKAQETYYLKQLASRDLALKIHEAVHKQQLAARDEVLTLKEADFLQKLAQQDDQFLRLTTQLQDQQRIQQQQDTALWTSREQVSMDPPSSAASSFHLPSRQLPPARCFLNVVKPPPPPPKHRT